MTWIYSQSTGELTHNGAIVGTGYSGLGKAKNDPNLEHMASSGPIPKGKYSIGKPHRSSRTGPHVLALTPIGHKAHGRTAFQIHGDSTRNPGTASSGCIIMPRHVREQISSSGDTVLEVVQ